jgi:NACalpha-BTF3-like transcription factor
MLDHYKDVRERYEFQMGPVRGRIATALDILTDALALVGQHGVYCRSERQPQFPAMDVRLVVQQIEDSKALLIEAIQESKKSV